MSNEFSVACNLYSGETWKMLKIISLWSSALQYINYVPIWMSSVWEVFFFIPLGWVLHCIRDSFFWPGLDNYWNNKLKSKECSFGPMGFLLLFEDYPRWTNCIWPLLLQVMEMSPSQFAIYEEECEEGWEEDLNEDTSALAEFGKY